MDSQRNRPDAANDEVSPPEDSGYRGDRQGPHRSDGSYGGRMQNRFRPIRWQESQNGNILVKFWLTGNIRALLDS